MSRCKYWDSGWCYCNTNKSNDDAGQCNNPKQCEENNDNIKESTDDY